MTFSSAVYCYRLLTDFFSYFYYNLFLISILVFHEKESADSDQNKKKREKKWAKNEVRWVALFEMFKDDIESSKLWNVQLSFLTVSIEVLRCYALWSMNAVLLFSTCWITVLYEYPISSWLQSLPTKLTLKEENWSRAFL